jgi:hypothetical protein
MTREPSGNSRHLAYNVGMVREEKLLVSSSWNSEFRVRGLVFRRPAEDSGFQMENESLDRSAASHVLEGLSEPLELKRLLRPMERKFTRRASDVSELPVNEFAMFMAHRESMRQDGEYRAITARLGLQIRRKFSYQ